MSCLGSVLTRRWTVAVRLSPFVALWAIAACSSAGPAPSAAGLFIETTASAVMNPGERQALIASQNTPVPALWTTSDATVLTVDTQGVATAHARGVANVTATFDGHSAIVRITVIDNVQGTWKGAGRIDGCSSDGVGFPCTGHLGSTDMMTLRLVQVRDSVSGTLTVGAYPEGPAAGTVAPDGSVVINGTFRDNLGIRYSIDAWSGQVEAATEAISGRYLVGYRFNDGLLDRFFLNTGTFRITRTPG
jgi:hypothetical protein